jgi:hypothetical protein
VTRYCNAFRQKDRAHDLAHARYATPSQSGWSIYLCCGACGARYCEAVSVWESELRRRAKEVATGTTPAVRHDGWYRSTI